MSISEIFQSVFATGFMIAPVVILYVIFRIWRLSEKRKEQRQEMQILLLCKIAQKMDVDQNVISEIIKTL